MAVVVGYISSHYLDTMLCLSIKHDVVWLRINSIPVRVLDWLAVPDVHERSLRRDVIRADPFTVIRSSQIVDIRVLLAVVDRDQPAAVGCAARRCGGVPADKRLHIHIAALKGSRGADICPRASIASRIACREHEARADKGLEQIAGSHCRRYVTG